MDKIDLKPLFKDSNFKILIFSDIKQVKSEDSTFLSMVQDFINNRYFVFSEKNKVRTFEQNQILTYNDKDINFYRITRLIYSTKEKWDKEYPDIIFPKIQVSMEDSNVVYFNENHKYSTIHLKPETFFNIHNLRFTLGHELGHLAYKKKNIDYKFNHFNISFLLLMLNIISSFVLMFSLKNKTDLTTLGVLIFSVSTSLFLGINYGKMAFSFNSRMEKYNMELWCDFFSLKFMEINFYKRKNLFKIGENILGKTHPRANDRFYYIKKNKNISLDDWKPISQEKSKFFRFYYF